MEHPPPGTRKPARREIAAIALFLAAVFACAFLNPIFFDEAAYLVTLGRFRADGWQRIFLFPQCTGSFLNSPPPELVPFFLLIDLLLSFVQSLPAIRIFGTAIAAANILLF